MLGCVRHVPSDHIFQNVKCMYVLQQTWSEGFPAKFLARRIEILPIVVRLHCHCRLQKQVSSLLSPFARTQAPTVSKTHQEKSCRLTKRCDDMTSNGLLSHEFHSQGVILQASSAQASLSWHIS